MTNEYRVLITALAAGAMVRADGDVPHSVCARVKSRLVLSLIG